MIYIIYNNLLKPVDPTAPARFAGSRIRGVMLKI